MDRTRISMTAAVLVIAAVGSAAGQSTVRASVDSSGVQGNGTSTLSSLSADGRYIAFASSASNLVAADANLVDDVFVRDLATGVTALASIDSSGVQGNGISSAPSISADGRYVAFESAADNLVSGDTNGRVDVFVRDLVGGVTTRASVDTSGAEGDGDSQGPAISGDGRFVVFTSAATTLVAGDTNGLPDVFVRDLLLAETTRSSVHTLGNQGNGASRNASISADGRYVAFVSGATNLIDSDPNLSDDIFLRDRELGTTTRIVQCSPGAPPDCLQAFLSPDGGRIAFTTFGIDFNGQLDVFVLDIQSGITTQVTPGGFETGDPALSGDGRYLAFKTEKPLVPGDSGGHADVFVRDLDEGVTTRVSVTSTGVQADDGSFAPTFSADGRILAFASLATNLVAGDTNGGSDVFVRDWQQPALLPMCFGDGSGHACPCGNSGLPGHGCENSAGTGGAQLTAVGTRRLSEDTFVLTSTGELPTALSVFFQGKASVGPLNYGDGLRCIGGTLKRLYVKNASGGVAIAPQGAEVSVSARSSALGDAIQAGTTRWYQVFHRDPNPAFCPNPPGNTWNSSSGIEAAWGF